MTRTLKIIIWGIFWTTAYFVLLSIFASSSQWQKIDYVYTAIFMTTLMGAVWVNSYLPRRRIWLPIFIGTGCAFAAFNYVIFDKLIDLVLPGYYFISYYSYLDLLKFFGSFLGLTTLISLSMEWFQLEKEKATAEFKALVNQVNPHFLFNSLTVIYSLSLWDNRQTSLAVIKLSDILRYVIYKSTESTASLTSEVEILRDYIDLQRYRIHPTTRIEFTEHVDNDVSITPMLFLPLVENAFKHGVQSETENAWVKMTLRKEGDVVSFMISNKKSTAKGPRGIGLKNLEERLKLMYPNRYLFAINETESEFNVSMKIML